MAYQRPPLFVRRVFNPLALRFGIGGAQPLVVARRRSGTPQQIPVIPVEHAGTRYLVSTRGESDWVKNVRAAGEVQVGGTACAVSELPVGERDAVISAYRRKAGRQVEGYWKQLPDPADHPVFALRTR